MFPRNKGILLCNYHIAVKIRKFTLIHYYPLILRPQSSFYIFLNKVLYSRRSSSESRVAFSDFSLVSFSLGQFLSLSFVILILQKSTRPLFCRLSLHLGLSDVSSWLGSGHASLVRLSQKGCCALLIVSYQECMTLTYPNTGNVLCDHLIKKVSARLLLRKVLLFAFVISKYFTGRNFEPMKISHKLCK